MAEGKKRKVLSRRISNSMDSTFCVDCLEDALRTHGKPEIFNSDQGSQFTSTALTDILKREEIKISMDGRGRTLDNIFVERLWRNVKYEDTCTSRATATWQSSPLDWLNTSPFTTVSGLIKVLVTRNRMMSMQPAKAVARAYRITSAMRGVYSPCRYTPRGIHPKSKQGSAVPLRLKKWT